MIGGGGQVVGQHGQGRDPVDVVGVDDGEGAVTHEAPGALDGVDGAQRNGLEGRGHGNRRGPGLADVIADGRSGGRPQDEDDRAEAGPDGVAGVQVDDGLSVDTDGSQRFAAAVAPGHPGGHHHEDGPAGGTVTRGSQPPHRKTALAQVIPPPKPDMRTRAPGWRSPVSRASARASGTEADEVFP